ncbi:MAG: DUF47 family protein [Bacteroidales bacterium]|jgi:predicted phosphate transport protein (TIGR00153 family)|nr:DUF47 family protein [Bacteroidales bacterium]
MDNSILNRLTPKEPKFFPLLTNLSEVTIKVAKLLENCIINYSSENSMDYYHEIKELEKIGDVFTNDIFDALNSTFITPFDREDIHSLAGTLDDVTDVINRCAQSIAFYKPKAMPAEVVELTKLISEGAEVLQDAVKDLKNLKKNPAKINENCLKLHIIENKADEAYQQIIMKLFETEKDSIELIKLKEIVKALEQATDEADHVGKIIKTIIVKYA